MVRCKIYQLEKNNSFEDKKHFQLDQGRISGQMQDVFTGKGQLI